MKKVSVLIPMINCKSEIGATIQSALNQSVNELEVLCLNNGSGAEVIKQVEEIMSADDRVKLINYDSEPGDMRNEGIKEAKGDYILFLMPGDTLFSYSIESIIAKADRYEADCLKFCCPIKVAGEEKFTFESSLMLMDFSEGDYNRILDYKNDPVVFKLDSKDWSGLYRKSFLTDKEIKFEKNYTECDNSFFYSIVANEGRIIASLDYGILHNQSGEAVEKSALYDSFVNKADSIRRIEKLLSAWGVEDEIKRDISVREFYELRLLAEQLYGDDKFGTDVISVSRELSKSYPYAYLKDFRRWIRFADNMMTAKDTKDIKPFFDYVARPSIFGERKTVNRMLFRKKNDKPKVSVIVPIYNQEGYLNLALNSLTTQSMKDLEFICVNDGSKDSSMAIIKQFAAFDERMVIIDKENSGYGHSMNVGMDAAHGEYIGILEPDDFVRNDTFETLFMLARNNNLDMIKADHVRFGVKDDGQLDKEIMPLTKDQTYYGRLVNPQEELETINFVINTWSGIYKRSFLNKNNIRHNETGGASFQDNGFWFQTFLYAKRAWFVKDAFYSYRRDNPNASVYSSGKFYAITNEYKFIWDCINREPDRVAKYEGLFYKWELANFVSTYYRLAPDLKLKYLWHTKEIFEQPLKDGKLKGEDIGFLRLKRLHEICEDPQKYYDILRLSIVLPIVDAEGTVEVCLDSLLMKNEVKMELIAVCGKCTDGSAKILERYADKDSRIRVVECDSKDYGALRKKGLEEAAGDFVLFANTQTKYDYSMPRLAHDRAYLWNADVVNYWDTDEALERDAEIKRNRRARDAQPFYGPFKGSEVEENVFEIVGNKIDENLYRKEFLISGQLCPDADNLNEDAGFVYKAVLSADKMICTNAVLAYRLWDNEKNCMASAGHIHDEIASVGQLLKDMGLFERYEQDYVNYALGTILNAVEAPIGIANEENLNKIRDEWFSEFGIAGRSMEYFYYPQDLIDLTGIIEMGTDKYKLSKTLKMGAASKTEAELEKKEMANKKLVLENARIKERVTKLINENEDIKNSASFKIGRQITGIPRKTRDILKFSK